MGLHVNRIYGPIYIAELESNPANGSRYYTSGETIRSTVSVDPKSQPQRIEIIFHGRVKWAVVDARDENVNHIYDEDVELFSYRLQLFTSASGQSYDLVNLGVTLNNRVEIPFEFTFPYTAQSSIQPSSRGEPVTRFRVRNGFESTNGHILPPSYSYNEHNFHQRVDYYLEAQIYTASHYSNPDIFVHRPVLYRPLGPLLPEDSEIYVQQQGKTVTFRTYRLDPNLSSNEGFLKRLKHGWIKHRPSIPSATFNIHAKIPRIAAIDALLSSISFGFIYVQECSDIPHQPSVYLRKLNIRVISTLKVRAPQFWNGKQQPDDYEDSHRIKNVLVKQSFDGAGVLMYEGLRVVDLGTWKERLDAPDFQSYGLNLSHIIEIMLWVECKGEKKKVLACQGPITIIAGIAGTVLDATTNSTNGVGVERDLEPGDEVPLPPYTPPPYTL